MAKLDWVSFDKMKASALKETDFRQEYEALREESELAREVIELRKRLNQYLHGFDY